MTGAWLLLRKSLLPRPESAIEIANRLVPLWKVLQLTSVHVPDFSHGKSVKARCPYADMYHLTEDASKSMRVYPESNTGYCYMGCGVLTPVSVHARINGISYKAAAFRLLDLVGHKLKTLDEKWNDAVRSEPVFNREGYRDALVEYCRFLSGSDWTLMQYEERITSRMSSAFLVLDKASSDEDAYRWLEAAKSVMKQAIDTEIGNALSEA